MLLIGCEVLCLSLFCCALFCVLSSFAIILKRKRELVALLLLSFGCLLTVNVLWLFLMLPWIDLWCVIVVLPDPKYLYVLIHIRERVRLVPSKMFKLASN